MEGLKETIGNVVLDYSLYPGEDFYSEGAEEDLLLETVKNHTSEEYNRLIAENARWSMLYHLSNMRGNIVDFIHLTKSDHVLEVGAGCGAITGTLAERAGSVTCIELSKKRSLINAYRNKDCDNIEIKVGNFQDIEQKLTKTYDYIMLIGVFEYAASYIQGEKPYERFLSILSSHLKEGGRLVMAIENKYGMKYWAGCREDHTGRFFEGIEGYRNTSGVRTFSIHELEKFAKKGGFSAKFYYPYPDYKLPVTIYSDEKLPEVGELQKNHLNFDNTRVLAFNEENAFDETIREGNFPYYSNSLLMVLQKGVRVESFGTRNIIYSRHSNDRSPEFAIRTDIEKDGYKKYYVVKYPKGQAAVSHIKSLEYKYEELSKLYHGTVFTPNHCKCIEVPTKEGVAAEFEYLNGPTLESELDRLLEEGKKEEVLKEMDEYVNALRQMPDQVPFVMTEEFKEIFGDAPIPSAEESLTMTNLDLIFSNIILQDGWNVIDYEWTFHFPIPITFVIYRMLFYYGTQKKRAFLEEFDLYERYGISEEMRKSYEIFEHGFQSYIAGKHLSLVGMYSILGRDATELQKLVNERILPRIDKVKVYYDLGNGFDEDNTCYHMARVTEQDEIILDFIPDKNVKAIRIDPADDSCMVMLKSFPAEEVLVNGMVLPGQVVYYMTKDPQIIISSVEGGKPIHIEYIITKFREDFFEKVGAGLREYSQSGIHPGTFLKKRGPYEKVRLS